jgi:NitT/TauT family transport system substrate-binding protein
MVPAPVSDSGIYIADAKGWFAEQGIKLDVQNFATAADAVAPLARDQLQVAGGSTGAGLSNAVNRGVDVFITADKATTSPGHGYAAILVRTDLKDQIKSPADFKGKKIAIGGKAIAPESALAQALKQANLTPKDVDLTTMPIPDMPAAMAGKSIDIALPVEPTVTAIVSQGTGVLLARTDQYEPNEQFAVLLYSPAFAKTPLAEKFMTAYLKGVRYYNDAFDKKVPAARQEVIDILSSKTTLKDKALYDKVVMPGLDPDGKVNVQDLKLQEAYYIASGQQQGPTNFDKLVNMSFAEAAVKQLGPYSR